MKTFLINIPVRIRACDDDDAVAIVEEILATDPILLKHIKHGDDLTAEELDESSSASRQHFIETGRYLTVREVAEDRVAERQRSMVVTYGGYDCCDSEKFRVIVTNALGTTTYRTCTKHRDECAAVSAGYVDGWGDVVVRVEKAKEAL